MNQLVARCLDGSRVEVSSATADLSGAVTSRSTFMIGSELIEIVSGGADYAFETVQAVLEGVPLLEEYSFQGGRLRLGVKELRERTESGVQTHQPRVAVWDNGMHSFFMHRYHGTTTDLLKLMSLFTVTSMTDGVTVRPSVGSAAGPSQAHPSSVITTIKETGVLEAEGLSAAAVKQLPRWRGTAVRGGELFVQSPGERRMHFVLVSKTARAQLVPKDVSRPERALSALESMTLSWHSN